MKIYYSQLIGFHFVMRATRENFRKADQIEWIPFKPPIVTLLRLSDSRWFQDVQTGMRAQIEGFAPNSIVGYSLFDFKGFLSFALFYAAFSQRFRDDPQRPKLILGGPMFYFLDQGDFTNAFPLVDHVVVGPGERAFVEILEAIDEGRDLPRILERSVEERVHFPDPSLLAAAKGVLFCSHLFDDCDWGKCRFCHHSTKLCGNSRPHIGHFCDELVETCRTQEVRHVYLFDNNITSLEFEELLSRWSDGLIAGHIKISLFGMRFDPHLLPLIKKYGKLGVISDISWGLESFSQAVLQRFAKGVHVDSFAHLLQEFAAAGVKNNVYILLGLPGLSQEEIDLTWAGLAQNRSLINNILLSWFLLSPGTEVFNSADQFGVIPGERFRISDSYGFDVFGPANVRTHYRDFQMQLGGKTLSRQMDFERYHPGIRDAVRKGIRLEFAPELFFLGSTVERTMARDLFSA